MARLRRGRQHESLAKIFTMAAVLVISCAFVESAFAQAQGKESEQKGGSWARKHEIDPLTAKRLLKAQEFLAVQDFVNADATLDALRVRSLNAKERSKLYALRGYVALGREDFPAARENFELTIAQGVLEAEEHADLRFLIAQICLQEENYKAVITNLEKWFALEKNPNSTAYYFLALAYWQLSDADSALEPALTAVALSDEPQQGWLQLLLAIRLTRKEYHESIPILDQLIRRFPKKSYWIQLSTLHGALGNYEESLIPLQLAYTQGLLTEDLEIRRLAELLLYLDLPYRAAAVMRSGLELHLVEEDSEYFELLSNCWIMAREYDKAVDPLVRAGELAESGRIYLRLAEVHIQRERWGEATEALGKAIEKGELPNPGQAKLLMGIALYSQKQSAEALDWFGKASKYPETETEAENWVKHIQRESSAG